VAHHTNILDKLRDPVSGKRGWLKLAVIILHDTATFHTAHTTKEWFKQYEREKLRHPPGSLHLAPLECHLFAPQKVFSQTAVPE
jgi:hypothetical protein